MMFLKISLSHLFLMTSHVKFTIQVTEVLEERLIASGALPTIDQLDNDFIDTRLAFKDVLSSPVINSDNDDNDASPDSF